MILLVHIGIVHRGVHDPEPIRQIHVDPAASCSADLQRIHIRFVDPPHDGFRRRILAK